MGLLRKWKIGKRFVVEKSSRQNYIAAWCVDIVQAFYEIKRVGQSCTYGQAYLQEYWSSLDSLWAKATQQHRDTSLS